MHLLLGSYLNKADKSNSVNQSEGKKFPSYLNRDWVVWERRGLPPEKDHEKKGNATRACMRQFPADAAVTACERFSPAHDWTSILYFIQNMAGPGFTGRDSLKL